MGRRVWSAGVGVGEPLGSPWGALGELSRSGNPKTHLCRACSVCRPLCPSQPLVPMQPKVERSLHMRATHHGIVYHPRKKKEKERERGQDDRAGGQDRTQSRHTRRTRRTRYLDKGTGQPTRIEHCRTGSQNSAPESESRRPTSLFGRQAPRIVLASVPQVDFHLSSPHRA